MINDLLRNEDENDEYNSSLYNRYRKKSYIVFGIMATLILILLILVFLKPSTQSNATACDSFKFENTKVFSQKQIWEAGENMEFILNMQCDNGASFQAYKDVNELEIKLEMLKDSKTKLYAEDYVVNPGRYKGQVIIILKSTTINVFNFNIYIKKMLVTNSPLKVIIIPSAPVKFEIKNFEKELIINKNYTTEITLFDNFSNNVIQDNYFISCSSAGFYRFPYEISIPKEDRYNVFQDKSFTIGLNNENKFVLFFRFSLFTIVNVKNLIVKFIVDRIVNNQHQTSIIENPNQTGFDVIRLIDINQSIFTFINSSEIEISLFDANKNPINFIDSIKITIKGDKYSCEGMSFEGNTVIFEKNSIKVAKVILKESEISSIQTCKYFIISFSDPSKLDITVIHYKSVQVEINIDDKKKFVPKIYSENFNVIANKLKTEYDFYLKDVLSGLQYFFNFEELYLKDIKKFNAALYFVLIRLFKDNEVFYYSIIEEVELYGEINVLDNRYKTLSFPSTAVARKFFKVLIKISINSIAQDVFIYFDEFLRPLVFDATKGELKDIFYFKDEKLMKVFYEETTIAILKIYIIKYSSFYADLMNIYNEIFRINPSIIYTYDAFIADKIKADLNNDVFVDFRKYIAFDKTSFVQLDTKKISNPDYVVSAIYFSLINTIKKSFKILFIDTLSIKLGVIDGEFTMIFPQGSQKNFSFKKKLAYEVIIYVQTKENVSRYVVYIYYSNFNLIIKTEGTDSATFVPNIEDGRSSFVIPKNEEFTAIFNISSTILVEEYIVIRKEFEDKNINPTGDEFDLCKDIQDNGKKVLVGKFDGSAEGSFILQALNKKGFKVDIETNPTKFIDMMNSNNYNSVWYIPPCSQMSLPANFAQSFKNFYTNNNSLMIWGDNEPCYFGVNLILNEIIGPGYNYAGNSRGMGTLKPGDGIQIGTFDKKHPLAKGFVNLFEGDSVCSWNKAFPDYKVFAMQTDPKNLPVIFYREASGSNPRVLMDCAFTKLYKQYYNQDVERYLSNAACWLNNIDNDIDLSN